jgi:hypothetical protein
MIQEGINKLLGQIAVMSVMTEQNDAIKRLQEKAQDQLATEAAIEQFKTTLKGDS